MYPEPESNRHDRNGHRILSPACLPVSPPGHRLIFNKKWSERRDSNPRPRPWQGRALPAELLSHVLYILDFSKSDAKIQCLTLIVQIFKA